MNTPVSRKGGGLLLTGAQAAHMAESKEARRRWLLVSPAMLIIGVAGLAPLTVILFYSFMSPGPYAGISFEPTFQAWINLVMEEDLFDETLGFNYAHLYIFSRSIGLALGTTILTLAIGFPTAYFIATRPSTQKNFWLFMISLPFWSNLLVRTFAIMMFIREKGFVNYILLNLDLIDKPLQIMFTPTAVWIGLVYAYLPLMVMPLYASMEKIDFRLVEAGYDLYASRWQVLRKVIVPLVKPGIVAGSILVFIPSIGAYVTPKLLGGGKSLMIGNLISNQFGTSRDWPLGSALALFLMALVMVALIIYVKNETRNTNHG
ncbi:MAG TPA: ABC transporter permease [Arenicellales bacterium]|jgi:spermidine/putrescine transport system permease protein|nr:ABC transporter permease [Arenicellales bacterium]HJM01499.1 ABC transporter permease [Arenicellales bacterium]|tara:strand:+ start:1223 stop:2176 length:954 start_codon:yes stop_codon:yes gene_type:complete